MKIRIACIAFLFFLSLFTTAHAVDHSVQPLSDPPPADKLSKEIADQLSATGIRVIRGSSTTYLDLWPVKSLPTVADFKPTPEVLYPLAPGQLIGVVRVARKGSDFRDQDVAVGVYTLRYAQQPVDGAHVGTSLTRDFVLLVEADKDQSPEPIDYKKLTKQSAEAAGSSHPALLSMQRVPAEAKEFPSMRHDEERDWWIAGFQAQTKDATQMAIEIVVVGHAAE